jgi:hypothetical protein
LAAKPPEPTGTLLLDAEAPVVAVRLAGVPLRLRVDLDRQDSIELGREAAARLPLSWEAGHDMEIGRVRLAGRAALASLEADRRKQMVVVTEHGRDCCAGADGEIGPDLLPYAEILWRRAGAPSPTDVASFPLTSDASTGLSAAGPDGTRIKLALDQPVTIATATAGAILSRQHQGRWDGPPEQAAIELGIARPVRPVRFASAPFFARFRFDRLIVRIADYGGGGGLPGDPPAAGEIVVAGRREAMHPWPAIVIGLDRLGRCAEIAYIAIPRTLSLACAFDR